LIPIRQVADRRRRPGGVEPAGRRGHDLRLALLPFVHGQRGDAEWRWDAAAAEVAAAALHSMVSAGLGCRPT
jgi:hypothetical protein